MGFPLLFSLIQRVLPKRRRHDTFDTLGDNEDDDESWRGSLATSTDDWNRIQEGQRMLQLSTSLWFGTDQGPFDMKDHERYELLYGRPIGVEDPVLEALRMQRHQIQGGIYVEPGRSARESSGFTPYTSMDGMLPAHEVDRAVQRLLQRTSSTAERNEPALVQAGEASCGHPTDDESRRLTNLVSFQKRLQPSMSWQFRMTRFRCSEDAAAESSSGLSQQGSTPALHWDKPRHAPQPTAHTAAEDTSMTMTSQQASPTPDAQAGVPNISLHAQDGIRTKAASPPVAVPSVPAAARQAAAASKHIPYEHEEEYIRHMAWKWRFTKRWCKEQTEPHAELSRRDAAFVEALAGAPSGAWSHLLHRTSTDGGAGEKDPNTLSESILFSDGGEDTAVAAAAVAGGARWAQWGAPRTSSDSRASSRLDAALAERGRWQEGRIRGGAP